MAICIERGGPI